MNKTDQRFVMCQLMANAIEDSPQWCYACDFAEDHFPELADELDRERLMGESWLCRWSRGVSLWRGKPEASQIGELVGMQSIPGMVQSVLHFLAQGRAIDARGAAHFGSLYTTVQRLVDQGYSTNVMDVRDPHVFHACTGSSMLPVYRHLAALTLRGGQWLTEEEKLLMRQRIEPKRHPQTVKLRETTLVLEWPWFMVMLMGLSGETIKSHEACAHVRQIQRILAETTWRFIPFGVLPDFSSECRLMTPDGRLTELGKIVLAELTKGRGKRIG